MFKDSFTQLSKQENCAVGFAPTGFKKVPTPHEALNFSLGERFSASLNDVVTLRRMTKNIHILLRCRLQVTILSLRENQ